MKNRIITRGSTIVIFAFTLCCLAFIPAFGQALSQRILRDFERHYGLEDIRPQDQIMLINDIEQRGLTLVTGKNSRGSIILREVVTMSTDAPFVMCGITLKMNNATKENIRVFVRPHKELSNLDLSHTLVTDKSALSWQYLPFDLHTEDGTDDAHPEEALRTFLGAITLRTHIATLPAETQWVEVKIEFSRSFLRPLPTLQQYQCFLYNPDKTDATTQELIRLRAEQSLPAYLQPMIQTHKGTTTLQNNSFSRPAFVTRTQWGCPWGQTSGPNTLTPTIPTHIIVHHSFSPGNDITDWAAAVRGIWNFHVNSNGWSDIGYNWLIDPQGVIYQGRAWIDSMDNAQGAHFCGFNRATMGICMLGDFNSIAPTAAAQRSLVRLLAYRVSANSIDPRAITLHTNSNRNLHTISGHRDGCATDCPGNMQYPLLTTYRNRVFALLNPPVISNVTMSVENAQSSVALSAFIRPQGSATQVFVEWGEAGSMTLPLSNRRLIREFSAQDTATTVATRITGLLPNTSYVYRIVAQNSDTAAQTSPTLFSLTPTNVATHDTNDNFFLSISPNPTSNGEIQCTIALESSSHVRLTIRDVRGTIVSQPMDQYVSRGQHTFIIHEDKLASGVYYCYLEIVEGLRTRSVHRILSVLR